MARNFNGTTDKIICNAGTQMGVITGPATYAAVVKKGADAVNGSTVRVHDSGGTLFYGGLQWNTTNNLRYFGSSATVSSTFTFLVSEGWCVIAGSKTSGTTAPRFHKQNIGTGTWTHADAGSTCTDIGSPGATGKVWLGANGSPTFTNGDMYVCAAWNYILTDAQIEQLGIDVLHWLKLAPVGLWLFNQASTGTSVTDLTGNGADQSSISGTTVSADPSAPYPLAWPLSSMGAG